jgi:hypothetical protein
LPRGFEFFFVFIYLCNMKQRGLFLLMFALSAAGIYAHSGSETLIPNGTYVRKGGKTSCQICHEFAAPSSTSNNLNGFGTDFKAAGKSWGLGLAKKDSDNDSFSNEIELSCSNTNWVPSMGPCGSDLSNVYNPGDADVHPVIAIEKRPLSPAKAYFYAAPNPFNPATTLYFSAGASWLSSGSLVILSAQGKTVRSLRLSAQDMACGKFVWDGRTNGQAQAAAGVYTAALTLSGKRFSTRLVLIR